MAESGVDSRIFLALMGRVAALSLSPAAPIVYPNIIYPANGEEKADTYIVVGLSPRAPRQTVIDPADSHSHGGVLGLSIMTPPGLGEEDVKILAGQVAAHFPAGLELTSGTTRLRIAGTPYVAGGYLDSDRWRTPISVSYETIAS